LTSPRPRAGAGKNASNLVNATVAAGAAVVIGFEESVGNVEANIWIEAFISFLAEGKTVNEAAEMANSVIKENPKYGSNPTTDTYYIAGNGNAKFG